MIYEHNLKHANLIPLESKLKLKINEYTLSGKHVLVKLKLPVLVRPLSAIQPFSHPLTFNLPWSLGYIRKLAFWSPWGNYFNPGFLCRQQKASRNIKLAQIQPSQGNNSHLDRVESQRFISCSLRNSCQAHVGSEPRTSRSAVERATTGSTRPVYQYCININESTCIQNLLNIECNKIPRT